LLSSKYLQYNWIDAIRLTTPFGPWLKVMFSVNGEVEKILRSDGEQNMGINEDVKGIPGIVLQTLIDTVTGTFNAVQTLLCMQGRVLLWKVRILQKLIGKGMSHGGGNLGG
jgi:hypothetical protein